MQMRYLYGMMLITTVLSASMHSGAAYAHFFGGQSKNIDEYQIVFLPSPSSISPNDNSTRLNFSVLKDNQNINNIYAALTIKDQETGEIIWQMPYRLYEFSDITVPFTFTKESKYEILLESRVIGDPKYQSSPLSANFNLSVAPPLPVIPFDQLMLFYVTPVSVAAAGVALYLHLRGKL